LSEDWGFAGKDLAEDTAEGPDIGTEIGRRAIDLFGRQIIHGSSQTARPGRIRIGAQAGEAEIGDHGSVAHEDDVGRLEVAVEDADGVRCGKPIGDLDANPGRFVRRKRALTPDARGDRDSVEELHCEIEQWGIEFLIDQKVENAADIGM